jgi:periplasmic protein TonB
MSMAYLDTNTQKPGGLIAALAIHGGLVAAALLVAPTVMREAPNVFGLINPTVEKPEPVTIKEPIEDQKPTKDVTTLTRSNPPIDNDAAGTDSGFILPAGTGETLGGIGTGGGTVIEPKPDAIPPTPVFTTARINPRFANALQPTYPPGLIRQEVEGVAIVRVLVGADGRVKDVQLVRSDHPDFFAATERQARAKWRFVAATRDGSPIESWREMTVRFEMPN